MSLWSNTDTANSKPKYLSTADKAATAGVSEAEALLAANKAKGVAHAGWVKTSTYTDAQGSTRNKTEVLVAMSTITSDDNADDTTIGIDPVITIGTQPLAASVTSPADVVFTVVATVNNGTTPSYSWEVSTDAGSTWAAVSGATNGLATLTVTSADAEYVTGNEFRVVVSATGAASVTSSAVAATIA